MIKKTSEDFESITINQELFCEIAGISTRTLKNWEKEGRVKLKNKEVIVPRNKIFIFKKEVEDVEKEIRNRVNKMLRKKMKAIMTKLESSIADVQTIQYFLRIKD